MEVNLRLVDSHLDARLASPEAREDLRRITRMLPPVLGFQFECRLGSPVPRVDLLPRLLLTDASAEALLGLGEAPPTLPDAARAHPTWRALADFCRAWREPGSTLGADVMDVFLEFDLDQPPPEVPEPCVFVDFARSVRQTRPVAERSLELLLGDRLPASIRQRLAACHDALPPRAWAYSVGVMFPRGLSPLRLCLTGASLPEWLDYLERIGWPGERAQVEEALGPLPGLADRVSLDIDVGPSVGPKVGFELNFDTPLGSDRPRWEALLGQLVESGRALPGKRNAVLSWMGFVHQRGHPDAWPEGLRRAALEAKERGRLSLFLRRLSHLKLIHQSGQPLEAKVYLETLHRWLRYSEARQGYVFDDDAP